MTKQGEFLAPLGVILEAYGISAEQFSRALLIKWPTPLTSSADIRILPGKGGTVTMQHYLASAAFNGDAFAWFSCYDSRRKAVKALRDFHASLARVGERDPLKLKIEACSCRDASIHPVAEIPA